MHRWLTFPYCSVLQQQKLISKFTAAATADATENYYGRDCRMQHASEKKEFLSYVAAYSISSIIQPMDFSSRTPIRNLALAFIAWKSILLIVAVCSPGPGYDTSTSLSLSSYHQDKRLPAFLYYVSVKLTRWDAIYFTKTAHRGYLFEQEWAFGWGFSRLIKLCTTAIRKAGVPQYDGLESLVAIYIAHLGHFLSTLVLYKFTREIFPRSTHVPLLTSYLHIISPAGLFLSAPYAESTCALLTFSGCHLFKKSLGIGEESPYLRDLYVLLSGILFGIAATFRSNAILSGLLLLEEAFYVSFDLLKSGVHVQNLRRLIATGLGGLAVGAGFLLPQYIAYVEFCRSSTTVTSKRVWCQQMLPSISGFVQDHYWNVGPFRYWTVSNIPLFLLATPMHVILIRSSVWAFEHNSLSSQNTKPEKLSSVEIVYSQQSKALRSRVLRNLAFSQLLLGALTLVAAHVQIITRISSAYPVWMWYIASLYNSNNPLATGFAGLFASFLPPA
ncbi:hypothetical protein B0O99DRAFT_668254 [Bisporella sp. PMI_857]|nr:hypothetical protein B0O99DRAFT_669044 [Bisporella sp. PMI_857]KAH8600279.1 hypothetical protein B0O99DRAFT_668254 [Bisporella sp. PMI_857]